MPSIGTPRDEDVDVAYGRVRVSDARRPSGEDDAFRVQRPYLFKLDVVREYLAVDAQLPHLSRYELGILGPEIEDADYFLVVVATSFDPVVWSFSW